MNATGATACYYQSACHRQEVRTRVSFRRHYNRHEHPSAHPARTPIEWLEWYGQLFTATSPVQAGHIARMQRLPHQSHHAQATKHVPSTLKPGTSRLPRPPCLLYLLVLGHEQSSLLCDWQMYETTSIALADPGQLRAEDVVSSVCTRTEFCQVLRCQGATERTHVRLRLGSMARWWHWSWLR